MTADAGLDERLRARESERARTQLALLGYGVTRVEPLFPRAVSPGSRVRVETPDGGSMPEPDLTRWYVAAVDEAADPVAVADTLKSAPGVAFAEPDYLRRPIGGPVAPSLPSDFGTGQEAGFSPSAGRDGIDSTAVKIPPTAALPAFDDPLYPQQWHLGAVNAPAAWQWMQDNGLPAGGSRDVVVAVIDTGVDYNHPDLRANIWSNSSEIPGNGQDDDENGYVDDVHGIDATNPAQAGNPMDDHGHGTHVAGIVAAAANNGIGGVGVAYNVQIMPLKANQYSGLFATSDIAEAVYYATAQHVDVINMSFGGYVNSSLERDALATAFGESVLVAAAGNDGVGNEIACGGDPMYPAAHNWVLGVMASTQRGTRASFSNYDCVGFNAIEYEMTAPGEDIWSSLPGDGYSAWDGTSMSAPIVSGIAALLRSANPDKSQFSSRALMGQAASNATPIANALRSLTIPAQPRVLYSRHWLLDSIAVAPGNDGDGVADAGETLDLAIVVRNHWGKAENVVVTVDALADGAGSPDPFVTISPPSVNYGAIGSMADDDNGLLLDGSGTIAGISSPFRVQVSAATPNGHEIPFRVTTTARNGLDPSDSSPYTAIARFSLVVQRGRELPRVISQDTVLGKDDFWIVPDATLIPEGVTVTVEPGATIQLYSPVPAGPYQDVRHPALKVEGRLLVRGSADEPVEIYGPEGEVTEIVQQANGHIELQYARIRNPFIGSLGSNGASFTSPDGPIALVDHCYFYQVVSNPLRWYPWQGSWRQSWAQPSVRAELIRFSNFRGVGGGYYELQLQDPIDTTLLDSSFLIVRGPATRSVFLRNYKRTGQSYEVSRAFLTPSPGTFTSNAILNTWWDPDLGHWMRIIAGDGGTGHLEGNYWGVGQAGIATAIIDSNDDFTKGTLNYQPVLDTAPAEAYPFAVDISLNGAWATSGVRLGAGPVEFLVSFNRDMDQTVQPQVSFGPTVPATDYVVKPIGSGWRDPRTWAGTFDVTPLTGDGYQLIRVARARAADDPWLVTGDDAGRFRFEIITSGTEALNLQAVGGEGHVDLSWMQDDFDLLAGYNLYRSASQAGPFTRINTSVIPTATREWRDRNVLPGQPYYYHFTVVKTDMTESTESNVASAAPIDTIPPALSHTPVPAAQPSLPLTVAADVTDNVQITGVTLFYRRIGSVAFASLVMTHINGPRYTATIAGGNVLSPGIEYYIEATDGRSIARSGWSENPWQVAVSDRPVVTGVSPVKGPAGGDTPVVIVGSNFKDGATVDFSGTACAPVTRDSASQLRCPTGAHFPATVDVTVRNADGGSGTLLRAFTYEADTATVSMPNAGGGQGQLVTVPVLGSAVQGMASAALTLTFDAAILRARRVTTGTLTPGWSLASNLGTAGRVLIGMSATSGPVQGSGSLALVEFEVLGAPGSSSALRVAEAALNNGAIPATLESGTFVVDNVYSVAGLVSFWNGGAGIGGATLSLVGDRTYTGVSAASGTFAVSGAQGGSYTLSAAKTAETTGISSLDASLALQHAVELVTLSGSAATAADVDKSGSITPFDAFYILQRAAGLIALPFPGAGRVWDFTPASRAVASLGSNLSGQDFTGILLGDPTGNWPATARAAEAGVVPVLDAVPARVSLSAVSVEPGGQIEIVISVDAQGQSFRAVDLTFTYDPAVVSVVAGSAVKGTGLGEDWLLAANTAAAGTVTLAMAGASPVSTAGQLARLTFQAVGARGTQSTLSITRLELDEGSVASESASGRISIQERPTVTWANPSAIVYGAALGAAQLNASANVAGTFVYTPSAGTVLAAGTHTLSATFTPTDGASYTTATASVTLAVNQAVPVIVWSAPAGLAYGAALGAAQLNATANVSGTFVYAPAAGTILGAGTHTLTTTFTPADTANYAVATASVQIAITRAVPVLTWPTPGAISTGTPLGSGQLNATANVPGTFVYAPPAGTVLAEGTHTLSTTFTPTDGANYTTATASVSLSVVTGQVPATITWPTPAAVTYGTPLGSAQLNATANVPGTFVYTPAAGTVLGVGTHTLSTTFTPADAANYTTATASVSLVVTKATPVIAWVTPAAIGFGTALGAAQLNASAADRDANAARSETGTPGVALAGTFVYTPPAGTVLAAGTHTLSTTFTPTDGANYTTATASVSLIVTKAAPVIAWVSPAAIVYGTALGAAQLNASAADRDANAARSETGTPGVALAGTFVYTPPAGTVLAAGTHTLSTTFTPTDGANYTTATASVSLVVNKAAPVITWAPPAAITVGTALGAAQLNATANVPGTFVYTPAAGTVLAAGTHTLSTTFTPTDAANYTTATATVSLVVRPVPTLGVSPAALRYAGTNTDGVLSPITAPQMVTVTFTNGGTPAWTAVANQPWVQVTNGAGTGSGTFTVGIVNPGNVLAGATTVSATVTVAAPGAVASPQTVTVDLALEAAAVDRPPFGQVDTPAQDAANVQGAIGVTGWALDDRGVASVKIYRDCLAFENQAACQVVQGRNLVFVGEAAFLGGARGDLEAAFPAFPQAYRAGWGFLLLTNMLPDVTGSQPFGGQGPLTLYIYATDVGGQTVLLGRTYVEAPPQPTRITMANAAVGKPFGAIDTPGQGALVSGLLPNFGWALTPDTDTVAADGRADVTLAGGALAGGTFARGALTPGAPVADAPDIRIPPDGSTMFVFVDGVATAALAYNHCRGTVGTPPPAGVFCNDDIGMVFGYPTPQAPPPPFVTRTSNPTRYRNLDAGRGAIGVYVLDTTTLSNGLHTIAWSVTDSAGRTEGIGSRFFNVLNAGTDATRDPGPGIRPFDALALAQAALSPAEGRDPGAPLQERVAGETPGLGAHEVLAPGRASLRVGPEASQPDGLFPGPGSRVPDPAVLARVGFDLNAPFVPLTPDAEGVYHVRLGDLDRLELRFAGSSFDSLHALRTGEGSASGGLPMTDGHLEVNGELRELPIGAAVDPDTGVFTWAPPPGYLGTYRLVFGRAGSPSPPPPGAVGDRALPAVGAGGAIVVDVTIAPRTLPAPGEPAIRMHLDAPTDGATVSGPLTIAGWAIDPQAATGTGIDAVHVWVQRTDVAGMPPVFLGAAELGGPRPDVAAAQGAQFDRAGFALVVPGVPLAGADEAPASTMLAPGTYAITVYAWNARTQRWEDARISVVSLR